MLKTAHQNEKNARIWRVFLFRASFMMEPMSLAVNRGRDLDVTDRAPTSGPIRATLTVMAVALALPALTTLRLMPAKRKKRAPMVVQVKFQPLASYGDFAPESGTARRRGRRRGK